MDHQDLLTHLRQLATSLDAEPGDLAEHLAGLITALQRAVSGYAGFRLTVLHSSHPVTLTVPVPERVEDVSTSLGIPLPLLSPVYEPGGRAVFYSVVSGAFVDLAADLSYHLPRTNAPGVDVALGVDLPLAPSDSMLTGLEDLVTLNRTVGVLIGQGQHPDHAHQILRSRAAASGLHPVAFAAQILGR